MDLLSELIGKKVALLTEQGTSERQEVGMLEAANGHWVKLVRENKEAVFYSVYLIRSIRLFGTQP